MKKTTLLLILFSIVFSYEIQAGNNISVSNFAEFQDALKNPSVTMINVTNSFHFTKNIVDIPNRDVTIMGNKDLNVIIYSDKYSIYGKQNYKGRNIFSIINADISGDDLVGRFFTGGAGNGPSSRGWDVYACDVNYQGARFVHLSEGTLTFDGSNTINTSCENAWVHSLVFKAKSTYKGSATTIGQFSAFYFNGDLIKGKATGVVDIQESARVELTISPDNDKYYYYPAFYDKVYKVDVQQNALFTVNAAGVAFQFIPRADYLQTPSLNIKENATVELIGRGGGNYATVKLQYYNTSINALLGSLTIKGNSTKSVIESIYKGAEVNIQSSYLRIENKRKDSPLFYSKKTTLNLQKMNNLYTWEKIGGEYESPATKVFNNFNEMKTIINKNSNGVIETNFPSALIDFQIGNYGKIEVFGKGIFRTEPSKSIMNSEENLLDINVIKYFSQNGILTITANSEMSSLEVYNLQGRLLVKEQTNSTSISTTLPNGVYIVKTVVNGQVKTQKVIVK